MKGIGASPGIAIGRALVIKKQVAVVRGILLQDEEAVQWEAEKFERAVKAAILEVEAIKAALAATRENNLDILETQVELLDDEQIKEDVIAKIKHEKKTANDAVIEVIDDAMEVFSNMKDEYFSARIADVQDAGNRILKHLNGALQTATQITEENTIIIAEDISPSDTIALDITKVGGFATQQGGKTSHAAIIAKAKGIPAVVGCGDELNIIKTNDWIIIDGTTGLVIADPSLNEIEAYTIKKNEYAAQAVLLKALKGVAATTTDGVQITLLANTGNAEDLEESFEYGSEGSGLLRTELLFMGRTSLPTEDEQFEFYKSVALKAKGRPVIVRTLDIGGDKPLPYFGLPAEQNPFLGYRAIRICLDRQDIFITQLKAILRASIFGNLKIMFPMICNVQEVRQAKGILEEAKKQLSAGNVAFNAAIPVGIMIEIPSAAVTADILAKEVDFFSIGTNDLCQYTLAVDRMNEKIKYLYDPFNLGVLRLIQNVIEQGRKHKIHVGMCGELAGDPAATLLLLGMGLNDFSMSATSIPYIKKIIINTSIAKAKGICSKVMAMDSSEDIINYLHEVNNQ